MNKIKFFAAASLLLVLQACAPEAPRVRVQNQYQQIADVALKPPSGSTININDVGAGAQTGYIEIPASKFEVDVNIENTNEDVTTFFQSYDDETYTIVIESTSPPSAKVKKP